MASVEYFVVILGKLIYLTFYCFNIDSLEEILEALLILYDTLLVSH
jgi:hypothetical protein